MGTFDYEAKVWGANNVRLNPFSLGAMRLRYCLAALKSVRGKILEIGCGGGGMAKALKFYRRDLLLYACDVSKTAIVFAKKDPQGVHFVNANAYRLPYKNNSLDAVVLFDVLEHVDNPLRAIRELYRVLKPGGVFHSYTPCEGSPSNYDFWFRKLGWQGKRLYAGHIQKFSGIDLLSLMRKEGFTVISHQWSNHLINQLFDAAYFVLLSIRGKNVDFSLESFVASRKTTLLTATTSLLLKIAAFLSFTESFFLPMIPGHGMHITCRKK